MVTTPAVPACSSPAAMSTSNKESLFRSLSVATSSIVGTFRSDVFVSPNQSSITPFKVLSLTESEMADLK